MIKLGALQDAPEMLPFAAWFIDSLLKLLRRVSPATGGTFVDLGSGKGPFTPDVLSRVLRNIDASFSSTDRRAWLIYNTPVDGDLVHETGTFRTRTAFTIDGAEFDVFERHHHS